MRSPDKDARKTQAQRMIKDSDKESLIQLARKVIDGMVAIKKLQSHKQDKNSVGAKLSTLKEKVDKTLDKNDPIHTMFDVHGIEVHVEWPKGSTREYGKHGYSKLMQAHYGYFPYTLANDNMELDTYVGDHLDSERVFVLNQLHPATQAFDEEKIMLGYRNPEEAMNSYCYHMGSHRFGGLHEITLNQLREKIEGIKKSVVKTPMVRQAIRTRNRTEKRLYKEKESKDELVEEHERLVDVLESPSHEDDKEEAKRQKKELKGLKEGKGYKSVNKGWVNPLGAFFKVEGKQTLDSWIYSHPNFEHFKSSDEAIKEAKSEGWIPIDLDESE